MFQFLEFQFHLFKFIDLNLFFCYLSPKNYMKKTLLTYLFIVSSFLHVHALSVTLCGSVLIGGVKVSIACPGDSAFSNKAIGLINLAQTVVSRLVPLLIGLAVLAFFWFLVEYIWKGKDDPEEYTKGRAGMFYSVVAIFVMVSIWGIIGLIGSIFGVGQGGDIHGFRLPGT